MTNLTELWKKGKLPSGFYYVKNEFGNIFPSDYSENYDYISDTVIKDFFTEVSEIKEVIERVPSYEDWKAKLEENAQFKELLNETKTAISSALNFLACPDRISETECNEQLAFDVLRKALEELDK